MTHEDTDTLRRVGSATSRSVPPRALTFVITLCSLALFAPLLWPLAMGRTFGRRPHAEA